MRSRRLEGRCSTPDVSLGALRISCARYGLAYRAMRISCKLMAAGHEQGCCCDIWRLDSAVRVAVITDVGIGPIFSAPSLQFLLILLEMEFYRLDLSAASRAEGHHVCFCLRLSRYENNGKPKGYMYSESCYGISGEILGSRDLWSRPGISWS